jgi:hypothetical protein
MFTALPPLTASSRHLPALRSAASSGWNGLFSVGQKITLGGKRHFCQTENASRSIYVTIRLPQGTLNATVVANLRRHYPVRFSVVTTRAPILR